MPRVRGRSGYVRRRRLRSSRRRRSGFGRSSFRRLVGSLRRRSRFHRRGGGRGSRHLRSGRNGLFSTIGRRPRRMSRRARINAIKANNRPVYYYAEAGSQVLSTVKQNAWQEYSLAHVPQLQSVSDHTYNYGYGIITGDPANASWYSSIFLLDSMSMHFDFKNNGTGDLTVTLFEVLPRAHIDVAHSIVGSLSAATTELLPQAPTSANYLVYTDLGFHPYHSPSFREYFKIRKSKTIVLRPGKTFKYALRVNIPKFASREWLKNTDYQYLKHLTKSLLIRLQGDIGTIPGDSTGTGVTIAAGALDVIQRNKYTTYAAPGLYGVGAFYTDGFPSSNAQPIAINSVNGMPNWTWSSGTSVANVVSAHI